MTDPDIEVVRGNTICSCGAHTSGVCATEAALDRVTIRLAELEVSNRAQYEAANKYMTRLATAEKVVEAARLHECIIDGRSHEDRSGGAPCPICDALTREDE